MTSSGIFDLLLQNAFKSYGISGEFRDTFSQLLDSHGLLIEVEAEFSLIVNVRLLGDIKISRVFGDQLLWNLVLRVVELFEIVGLNFRSAMRPSNLDLQERLTAMVR